MIEDDPVLGTFVDNYPSDRTRLLIVAGSVLAIVWFVTTVALWQVDDGPASLITVAVIGIATLIIGWFLAHYWNREVILFKRGFSYREGSYEAYIRFQNVVTIHQKAERFSYFGGLIRRNIYRVTLTTDQDEKIVLHNNFYRKMSDLSLRMDIAVTETLRPKIKQILDDGKKVAFGDDLMIGNLGLHVNDRDLLWEEMTTVNVKGGQLRIASRNDESWYTAPIEDVANIRLLLELLRERLPEEVMA